MVGPNLRHDALAIAQGSSASVWNVTDTDTGINYALKMFKDDEAFVNEAAAYERMMKVPVLSGRIPHYYETANFPRSIFLGNHDGKQLDHIIQDLSPAERATIQKQLNDTLHILHRDAGVYHNNINPRDIIIQDDGSAMLVNFRFASLKEDVPERRCPYRERQDLGVVHSIFSEVASDEAEGEAISLIESLCNGEEVASPQPRLAELLARIEQPEKQLVASIIEHFKNPDPVLALPLARCLAGCHNSTDAVQMLTQAAAPYDTPLPDSSEQFIQMILQMKIDAARYLTKAEDHSSHKSIPNSAGLYEDAVCFYLCSTPGATLGDETVNQLRHELAQHLFHNVHETEAMRVCIRALKGAKKEGKGVALDILEEYGELIDETKTELADWINSIKKDKLEEWESKFRPWAELPKYERAYRYAQEAESLLSDLWASSGLAQAVVAL